jgi:hypothetical protein
MYVTRHQLLLLSALTHHPARPFTQDTLYHCGVPSTPPKGKGGCLFNVFADPTEHVDIAKENPTIVQEMYARILELQKTSFTPNRGADDGTACKTATKKWKGFWGPFLE